MNQILFNTEMVKAILDGRKSVTRRLIKPRYQDDEYGFNVCTNVATGYRWIEKMDADEGDFEQTRYVNPPYKIGDVLYVRETWRVGAWNDCGSIAVDYFADGYADKNWIQIKDEKAFEKYWVQSTEDAIKAGIETDEEGQYRWEPGQGPTRWRPSIHMPKKAARIFLKVTGVRVERLQEMTQEDCILEGCGELSEEQFAHVWNSTIKKTDLDQYGWEANPWVWVIEFERCEKEASQ